MSFLGRLVHGNLGTSFALEDQSVERRDRAGRCRTRSGWRSAACCVEIGIGIPIGIAAAYRPRGVMDRFATLGALVGLSAPPFWLGLMLLYFLGLQALRCSRSAAPARPFIWYLILPSFTLGVGGAALYSRMVRTTMLAVLRSPYIEFARLKGMPERTILLRHALRHVLTPVITMLGMDLGYFLGGVLIIESVFGLPGVGQLAYNAIGDLDIPMITGTVLLAAVFMVVMSFVVDVTYTVVDPRVRLSRR